MTDTPKRKKRWRVCKFSPGLEQDEQWHVVSDDIVDYGIRARCDTRAKAVRVRTALNALDERERVRCVCTPWEWSYWLQRWVIWHGDSMYMVYQLPKGSIGCPKCLRKIRSKETS